MTMANFCSICCDNIDNNKITIECGHQFHNLCILEWLKYGNLCPNCRRIVVFNTPNDNNQNIIDESEDDNYFGQNTICFTFTTFIGYLFFFVLFFTFICVAGLLTSVIIDNIYTYIKRDIDNNYRIHYF